MSFTKLKSYGNRVRVDLSKVKYFTEVNGGTELTFDNGNTLDVEDSFQTVSNRAAKASESAEPEIQA